MEGAITWEQSRQLTAKIMENLVPLTEDMKEKFCNNHGIVAVATKAAN